LDLNLKNKTTRQISGEHTLPPRKPRTLPTVATRQRASGRYNSVTYVGNLDLATENNRTQSAPRAHRRTSRSAGSPRSFPNTAPGMSRTKPGRQDRHEIPERLRSSMCDDAMRSITSRTTSSATTRPFRCQATNHGAAIAETLAAPPNTSAAPETGIPHRSPATRTPATPTPSACGHHAGTEEM